MKLNEEAKSPFLQNSQSMIQNSLFKDFFGSKAPQSTIKEETT